MMERWAELNGWPGYWISNGGTLRGPRGFPLATVGDKNGYRTVYIGNKKRGALIKLHRAVVAAFIGPVPPGMHVNHKNGVKDDNRVENLEIVTPRENVLHGFRVLGRKGCNTKPNRGSAHHNARLTEDDVRELKRLRGQGFTQVRLAARFGISQTNVSRILRGEAWPHVTA